MIYTKSPRIRAGGVEVDPSTGHAVGRDPRAMSQDEIKALGHVPMSPGQALRARCIDCCGGSSNEVRLCTAVACPSWPFRMGKNPWRQPLSEAQREARRANASRMLFAGGNPAQGMDSDAAGENYDVEDGGEVDPIPGIGSETG